MENETLGTFSSFINSGKDASNQVTQVSSLDLVIPIRRRPIPRKGHTKSRRGCYTCKKRKIKCQETWPICGHCEKAGMKCEYPNPPPGAHYTGAHLTPVLASAAPMLQPQATPTLFSLKDMQFFHHFLFRAYPHLPVGADQLWTTSMPAVAHKVSI
jgi:Fungal Zn(2)-Cys(6) binuclear cluster domain